MANYLVTGAAGFIGARTSEFLIKDGHTVADMFKASVDSDPPTVTIGGSSRLAAGAVSYVHARLSPGQYVLLCMLEDPSHRRHVRLGMVKEFTVR